MSSALPPPATPLALAPPEPALLASVVVVTRDAPACLDEALAGLAAQSLEAIEVVLVLNGPQAHFDRCRGDALGSRLRVIERPENEGFAGGSNRGIEVSRGQHILLLNDDAHPEPGWAEALVAAAQADPEIGMCASKVLTTAPAGHIDTAGHLLFPDGLNRGRGRLEADRGQYDAAVDVLFPSGAAALYRRAMLSEIGGFDERFFAYGDDTDLGLRARLAGWRCRYVPTAVAHHHGSATAGAASAWKAYHVERNRWWVLWKHFPMELILVSPLVTAWRYTFHALGIFTGRGLAAETQGEGGWRAIVGTILASQRDAWLELPAMLRERRRLNAIRKLPRRTVHRWLREYGIGVREIAWRD